MCLLAKHLKVLLLVLHYMCGAEKRQKQSFMRGLGKKQTSQNMVTICIKELHNQIAMANHMVCSVSPEKTHLNWVADVEGWV